MIITCRECRQSQVFRRSAQQPKVSDAQCNNCGHPFETMAPLAPISPDDVILLEELLPEVDLWVCYDAFLKTSGGKTVDDFLAYLLAAGFISPADYFRTHALSPIDIPDTILEPGDAFFDQFSDIGLIGEGSMGEVRLVRDVLLRRKVALKNMKGENISSSEIHHFMREAQITAQLDHPNIVPLYHMKPHVNETENTGFVMKFIYGQTLAEILVETAQAYQDRKVKRQEHKLRLQTRLDYFLKVCDAMDFSHSKGIIHRDLKPDNIMVGNFGEVYVMDWGFAKRVFSRPDTKDQLYKLMQEAPAREMGGSDLGSVVGSLGYMSPEQTRGDTDIDIRSDIFSLGIILFEIVTLKRARGSSGDFEELMERARSGKIEPIRHLKPRKRIDPRLRAIIKRAVAPDRQYRYGTVAALSRDVRNYLRGEEISFMPDSIYHKIWQAANKHRRFTLVVLIALLTGLAGFGLHQHRKRIRTEERIRYRETLISEHIIRADNRADRIDAAFTRLEILTDHLADTVTYHLYAGPPTSEKVYRLKEFQLPGTGPPDLAPVPHYTMPVSFDTGVMKLAPNVAESDVQPLFERLGFMSHIFRQVMLGSLSERRAYRGMAIRDLLGNRGVPVRWVYLGLEAGVLYAFPGNGEFRPEYDPRTRLWYRLAANHEGVVWGTPYIDLKVPGIVVNCSRALYAPDGSLAGVVSMDVNFKDPIWAELMTTDIPGVKNCYLLDDAGRVIASNYPEHVGSSSSVGLKTEEKGASASLELQEYPLEKVMRAVSQGHTGILTGTDLKADDVILLRPVPTPGWYYLEEIDASHLNVDIPDLLLD